MAAHSIDARVQEYGDWLAVALFTLVTVDMVTTLYAAQVFGPGSESNPLVRWSLLQGMVVFALVNILAVIAAVVLFDRILNRLLHTPKRYERYFAAAIEAWLGGLLAAGLLVFANNLTVIFFGRSLITSTGIIWL